MNKQDVIVFFHRERMGIISACLLFPFFIGCLSLPAHKVLVPIETSRSSAMSLFWYYSLEHRPALIAELMLSKKQLGISINRAWSLLQRMNYVDSKLAGCPRRNVRDERLAVERDCYGNYFESRTDAFLNECKIDSAMRISISDGKSSSHILCVAKEDKYLIYSYKWFEEQNGKLAALTNITSVSRVHLDGIIRKVLKSGRPISSEPEPDGTPAVTVFLSICQGDAIYESVVVNPHCRSYPFIIYLKGGNLMWKNCACADLLIREIETSVGIPFYTSIVGAAGWHPSDEGIWINKTENANDPFSQYPK